MKCQVISMEFHPFHILDLLTLQASSALGETSLSVSVTGNLSAVDGAGAEVVQEFISTTSTTSTTSSGVSSDSSTCGAQGSKQ